MARQAVAQRNLLTVRNEPFYVTSDLPRLNDGNVSLVFVDALNKQLGCSNKVVRFICMGIPL